MIFYVVFQNLVWYWLKRDSVRHFFAQGFVDIQYIASCLLSTYRTHGYLIKTSRNQRNAGKYAEIIYSKTFQQYCTCITAETSAHNSSSICALLFFGIIFLCCSLCVCVFSSYFILNSQFQWFYFVDSVLFSLSSSSNTYTYLKYCTSLFHL